MFIILLFVCCLYCKQEMFTIYCIDEDIAIDQYLDLLNTSFIGHPELNTFSYFKAITNFIFHINSHNGQHEHPIFCVDIEDDIFESHIVISVPVFKNEKQFIRMLSIIGMPLFDDVSKFIHIMLNKTTREDYCSNMKIKFSTILPYIGCFIYNTVITYKEDHKHIINNDFFKWANPEKTLIVPTEYSITMNQQWTQRAYNNTSVYNNIMIENLKRLQNYYGPLKDSLFERFAPVNTIINNVQTKLSIQNLNIENMFQHVDNNIHPVIEDLIFHLEGKRFLHSIWHHKENEQFNTNRNIIHDPNSIYLTKEFQLQEGKTNIDTITYVVSQNEEDHLFGSGTEPWIDFHPATNNIWVWQLIPAIQSTGNLLYLIVFVWIFGIDVDETQCRPRAPYLPSSDFNCIWPEFQISTIDLIEDLFQGWNPLDSSCDDYNTFISYSGGVINLIMTLFTPSLRPANLIPCLIWNIFIPLFVILILNGLLLIAVSLLFLWYWFDLFQKIQEKGYRSTSVNDELRTIEKKSYFSGDDIFTISKQQNNFKDLFNKQSDRMNELQTQIESLVNIQQQVIQNDPVYYHSDDNDNIIESFV